MGMEAKARPKATHIETDRMQFATVDDPETFMTTAFDIARFMRIASGVDEGAITHEDLDMRQLTQLAGRLALAVYGDHLTPKGNG